MSDPGPRRAAHVSAASEESYLLDLQLKQEGLVFELTRVSNHGQLMAALETQPSMVIADLPLPWPGAADDLSELQRTRPDIPVVYRWGAAGSWSVEDGSAQLGRSVRSALALGVDRVQSPAERRRVLAEVVRYQNAHLRLGQIDTWDWEQALDRATEIIADTAAVERVSVWHLRADGRALECDSLFVRSTREHRKGGELALDSAYGRAIDQATFVAAHDAQHDPRTSAFATAYLEPIGITSMLDAPIRRGGRVVGVVCLEHVGPSRQWNVVEQCAAAAFASVVARILEVRDRRRVEEQWEESQRLEVLGRLAATVAHDFGNLATVITGFSETLLADCPQGDSRRDALVAIRDAGRSAGDLVRHLLAYTTGHAAAPRAIDLVSTIKSALPLVQRLLGKGIALRARLPEHPLWVRLDPSQVHRVLLNLAANARDAMKEHGTFTLELDRTGTAAGSPGRVRLCATDDGHGIPPDVLPHIFEPLYTTKAGGGGTGLGLSAVQAIVEQAGGTISAESRPGVATSFTVLLPPIEEPEQPVASVAGT
jgi:signal transduction histidine kinase